MADEPKVELFTSPTEPSEEIRQTIRRALFFLLFFFMVLMIAAFGLVAEA